MHFIQHILHKYHRFQIEGGGGLIRNLDKKTITHFEILHHVKKNIKFRFYCLQCLVEAFQWSVISLG